MKKIFILFFILIALGCYSPADDYILDNTEYDYYDEMENEYSVDFFMEEKDDICISKVHSKDLLMTQKVLYELSGSKYESIKNVTLWIPHTFKSWKEFNEIRSYWLNEYDETKVIIYISHDIDDFIMIINPDFWFEADRCFLIQHVYLYELVYYLDNFLPDFYIFDKEWLLDTAWDLIYDKLNLSCDVNM